MEKICSSDKFTNVVRSGEVSMSQTLSGSVQQPHLPHYEDNFGIVGVQEAGTGGVYLVIPNIHTQIK